MLIVIFEALCIVVPNWAAALIVCGVLAIIAGTTLSEGYGPRGKAASFVLVAGAW